MTKSRQQEKSQPERREEILRHTADLIQTYGYKGFSYKDLSNRLGIAKASIHHHFPSKEDLGIAYCQEKIHELQMFRERIREFASAEEKLRAYLEKPKERLATKKMCGINAMQSDSADMSPELLRAVKELTNLDIDIVTQILAEGSSSGEFNFGAPPAEMAEIVVSALKGGLQCSRLYGDDSYERMCRTVEKMVLKGHE